MTPTVFLFDIDGTILDSRGAGRRAMAAAFEAVCPGTATSLAAVEFAGMTDLGIVRAGLRAAGQPDDRARIHAIMDAYLARIETELREGAPPRVLEGVEAALQAACGRPRTAVGLGTGNHVEGARHKLSTVGLWERFGFGGFGSDAEDRARMLAVGRDRGLAQLGVVSARVLVIGDTPRDVAAAREIGAQCLAVTTGQHDADTLNRQGADWVVDRLDAPGALAQLRA